MMKAELLYVDLENFKSYNGCHRLGPLDPFTAIIGPNGAGKSNFMDAISFVMGEKISSLRVRQLSDLIHGASIGKPVSHSAQVTAVFRLEDGKEQHFTRLIQGLSSDHKVNGKPVSGKMYMKELEDLGINVKAKNFLVFQGAIESIAMKNPKERTVLFEEMCGSVGLKREYDRLKAEMLQAELDTSFTYKKKKGITAERKEVEHDKEEAEKYQRLKNELRDKKWDLQLFRLFHNEREIGELKRDLEKMKTDLQKRKQNKEKAEEAVKEKKKERSPMSAEMAKMEEKIREMETEVNKKRMAVISAKVKTAHLQKTIEMDRKSLSQATKAHHSHADTIKDLEEKLEEVQKKRAEFEVKISEETESQGKSIELEEAKVREYNQLKSTAAAQSAQYIQELASLNREQKLDQDRLSNTQRCISEIEHKVERKGHEKEEAQKRLEKLTEYIDQSEATLEDQKRIRQELADNVTQSNERLEVIKQELESVTQQLDEAQTSHHDAVNRSKQQEVVEKLQQLYPGVYNRMVNLCHPIHERYKLAITRIFGKYTDAIVVDTEKTAQVCLQYLKDQAVGRETFLPLNYITVKPLKERLRNIAEPRNVRLLYDLVRYNPPEIQNAVLFVVNSVLVCETVEDAAKVAYEMEDGHKYDAVALDGTFFSKSGLITGGTCELERKARKWDEKHLSDLKSTRKKLSEELREITKKSYKRSELNTVEAKIEGIETRLKYAKIDKDSTEKLVLQLQKDLDSLTEELHGFQPQLQDINKTMAERETLISDTKKKINSVEDVVFADFCNSIGVGNIRQYEEQELQIQTDHASRRLDFEKQKNRILNQLEYEKTRDTQKAVERWERTLKGDEKILEEAKQVEQKKLDDIDKSMRNLERKRAEKFAKKSKFDEMDVEIAKAEKVLVAAAKSVQSLQKHIGSVENKMERKRAERHSILKQCKMEDIRVPMIQGNLDDVEREDQGASASTSEYSSEISTRVVYEREERIVVDYSALPDSLKDLDDMDEVHTTEEDMAKQITDLENTLQRIKVPNMKAKEKLGEMKEKLEETNYELATARKHVKKTQQAFERAKNARYDLFMTFFEHISNEIDGIYKALTKNSSAQAYLGPENPEEPYLGGINYSCVAPGKRFQPMSNLSGGEKTIAALALLFAIHSYHPAPFLVLDEIDASLDKTNISKVASYITKMKTQLQIVVISLKEQFYNKADAIIGICPDLGDCVMSQMISVDLKKYVSKKPEGEGEPQASQSSEDSQGCVPGTPSSTTAA